MKNKRIVAVLLALMLALSSVAAGLAQGNTPGTPARNTPNALRNPILTDNLLDMDVWSFNDNQVGNVQGLVINRESGKIDYILIQDVTGGFFDAGDYVPVPWSALSVVVQSFPQQTVYWTITA